MKCAARTSRNCCYQIGRGNIRTVEQSQFIASCYSALEEGYGCGGWLEFEEEGGSLHNTGLKTGPVMFSRLAAVSSEIGSVFNLLRLVEGMLIYTSVSPP
jgi:hypothetical protein